MDIMPCAHRQDRQGGAQTRVKIRNCCATRWVTMRVTTKMSSQSVVPIAVAIEEQSRHPKTQRFLGSGSSSGHKVFPTARFPRAPRRGHRTLFVRQLLFPRFGAWRRRRSWATQGQRQRRQNFAATKTRTGLVVAIPQQVPGHENTSGVSLGTRTPQKKQELDVDVH